MPLEHSASPQAFKRNVSTLMGEVGKSPHVQSRDQALAIAYATRRRAKKADGGAVGEDWSAGGPDNPFSFSRSRGEQKLYDITHDPLIGIRRAGQRYLHDRMIGDMNDAVIISRHVPRAMGGASPPWYVRNEARSMMHTGPILSAVPGRTDRHNMSVPAGSYVVPAHAVSHLGQSNTLAGMQVLGRMFGQGPYGAPSIKIGHGAGLPKPPHMKMSDSGGARGEGDGEPVPVVTAGGEYVIPPEKVMEVGRGDLKYGHKLLDAWMEQIKKDHARTIAKLPKPAKG